MPTASGIPCATHTPQEEPDIVNSTDFSTELFGKVDDAITDSPRHSQAIRSVSEVVTLGIRYGVKGVSQRAFYPWLKDNYGRPFPPIAGTHPHLPPLAYATIPDGTLPGRAYPDGHRRPLWH